MDVSTLNAVIEQLQSRVDHCQYMIEWSSENDRDMDMWCYSKVEAESCLKQVQAMVNDELIAHARRTV